MSLSIARIAIVGGGLAGLVAAWRLAQHGVRDVVLFEARPSLGGRILSVDAGGTSVDTAEFALDRFDLGTLAALQLGHRWKTSRNRVPPISGPACLAKTRSFAAQLEVSHIGCA